MKKIFCKDHDLDCCKTCHNQDQFFIRNFKGFEINHFCSTMYEIEKDVMKYLKDEGIENDCI